MLALLIDQSSFKREEHWMPPRTSQYLRVFAHRGSKHRMVVRKRYLKREAFLFHSKAMLFQRIFRASRYICIRRLYHVEIPLLDDLTQRGLIHEISRPNELRIALLSKKQVVYAGVDPTAKSLHIGHLIPFMALVHFIIRGHQVIPLIGGATGRIGDPTGRIFERQSAAIEVVEDNVIHLTSSIQRFFKRALIYASSRLTLDKSSCVEPLLFNNLQWHNSFNLLEFLREVGAHVRVNTMLNRESVQARLTSRKGITFTEFTYQLMQAYDFYYLHKYFDCKIQIGGSDQWGNILAGLELIGKLESTSSTSSEAYGLTTPLLTTSSGEKFGKSSGNAVWLDASLTSVFEFYQHFLKVADADLTLYFNLFTLLSQDQVAGILKLHNEAPEKRIGQRHLALELTELVHEKSGVNQATAMTELLFKANYANLKAEAVLTYFMGDPRLVQLPMDVIFETPLIKLATKSGLVVSHSAARNLVAAGGLYLNNLPVQDVQYKLNIGDLLDRKFVILRAGKDKLVILVVNDILS